MAEEFNVKIFEPLSPRYNIGPTQLAPIVRQVEGLQEHELALFKWGLIPRWAKEPSIGNRMINARAETASQKPSFRMAFRRQRCLVPATGFYEWKILDRNSSTLAKQPYCIRRIDGRVFAFAGLWDLWRSPENEEIRSFTILTIEPNDLLRNLHDRMPVIIDRDDYRTWLDPRLQRFSCLANLCRPVPPAGWTTYPVSTRVNNPRNDVAECIQPDPL